MVGYNMTPREVPKLETKYRRIQTKIPVPESISIFEKFKHSESPAMWGQPPVIWDRAEGINVYDRWGNMWIDWSSGVLVTNAGHGRKEICDALREMIDKPLLSTFAFYHELRAELTDMLQSLAPKPEDYKVFLLTTGSESIENAVKLARTYGVRKHGDRKHVIVGFDGAFHGRTLAAQLAGGMPAAKKWIVKTDLGFINAPFPNGYRNERLDFGQFLETLDKHNLSGEDVAGVISESYQGIGPYFFPDRYAKDLEQWCRENDVVLIMDEVQAGFGRTGRMFTFEHYGIVPDIITCGKGISSSLPISAVIGRRDLMEQYGPGEMTITHSGSPLPVAATVANIKIIQQEKLVERAASFDGQLRESLLEIQRKYPDRVADVRAKGLVGGFVLRKPGSDDPSGSYESAGSYEPDSETALKISERCLEKGLLMFAPVGMDHECIKICPPLTIPQDALTESVAVLNEAFDEIVG